MPLWKHMTGMYGHKWESQYGAAVHETWVRGLADVDGKGLAAGMRACLWRSEDKLRQGEEDWPPTLGEFRILCNLNKSAKGQQRIPLEAPKLTPEQLAARREDMKHLQQLCRDAGAEMERQRIDRLWDLRRKSRLSLGQMLEQEREPGDDDDKPDPTKGA